MNALKTDVLKVYSNCINKNADTSNVIALHGATASNGKEVLKFIVEIVG